MQAHDVVRISAIVVNYNGGSFISEALHSLRRQTLRPDEIIVVDNASRDGSVELIRDQFPEVRLIEAGSNRGFTGGSNLGATHSSGEILALLNSDAVAHEDWLAESIDVLRTDPSAAVVVGKIYVGTSRVIEQAGGNFNNLGNYWGRGVGELDVGQYDDQAEVAGVTACAMLLRRAALEGKPLFVDDIFMYGEELELSIRLRSNGWRIIYIPRAIVHHRGMGSVRANISKPRVFQQRLSNRNRLRIVARYFPARTIITSLHLWVLTCGYWNLYFLRHAGPSVLMQAIAEQWKAVMHGLSERRSEPLASSAWLAWMKRHSLRELLEKKGSMESVSSVK